MSDLIPYDIYYNGQEFIGYKEKLNLPYVTVSAKGIANGLSTKVNDGADFGPDTHNTTTLGWYEAIEYCQENNIYTILSKSSTYNFDTNNSTIYFNNSGKFTNKLHIIGNGSIINTNNASSDFVIFTVSENNAEPMYELEMEGFEFIGLATQTSISLQTTGTKSKAYIHNNTFNGYANQIATQSGIGIYTDISYNRFIDCGANGSIMANTSNGTGNLNIHDNVFIAGANSGGSNAIVLNNNYTGTDPEFNGCNIYGNIFINTPDASTSSISDVIFLGDPEGAGWNGCNIYGNIFNLTAGWSTFIVGVNTIKDVNILNNIFVNSVGTNLHAKFMGNYCGGTITVYGSPIINGNYISVPSSNTFGIAINSGADSDVIIKNNTFLYNGINVLIYIATPNLATNWIIDDNIYLPKSTGNNSINLNGGSVLSIKNNIGIAIPSPTISTNPPATGTVYQNTNPYDILINLPIWDATTSAIASVKYSVAASTTALDDNILYRFISEYTTSTAPEIIQMRVPAGWYYEIYGAEVGSIDIGTAVVQAV